MIEPEGTKVVIEMDREAEKTEGGIWIPTPVRDQHQMAGQTGKIHAIGPAVQCEFSDLDEDATEEEKRKAGLNIGDRVLLPKNSGIPLTKAGARGVQYRLISHKDVLARIGDDVEIDELKRGWV